MNTNIQEFLNPHYIHTTSVLYPVSDVKRLQLWSNYYLRWDRKMKEQQSLSLKPKLLEEKLSELQKRVGELQKTCL
jgi:myotubularin-related protein 1/2